MTECDGQNGIVRKKKCMHHGYNYGQPRRAWTWSKTSGMRLDATSPVCMRQLHRTDDGHNIRRSAGTLFFFYTQGEYKNGIDVRRGQRTSRLGIGSYKEYVNEHVS